MTEQHLNLALMRPAVNLDEHAFDKLTATVAEVGVNLKNWERSAVSPLKAGVLLVQRSEIFALTDAFDIPQDEVVSNAPALDTYLREQLPPSTRSTLHKVAVRARIAPSRGDSYQRPILTLRLLSPVFDVERQEAKRLIEKFFNLDEEPGIADVWLDSPQLGGVYIGRIPRGNQASRLKKRLQQNRYILPQYISFGPIGDVAK